MKSDLEAATQNIIPELHPSMNGDLEAPTQKIIPDLHPSLHPSLKGDLEVYQHSTEITFLPYTIYMIKYNNIVRDNLIISTGIFFELLAPNLIFSAPNISRHTFLFYLPIRILTIPISSLKSIGTFFYRDTASLLKDLLYEASNKQKLNTLSGVIWADIV